MVESFAPIVGAGARVLILGTLPSRASLEAGYNYAHPRNAFWPMMFDLFGAGEALEPTTPFSERAELLRRSHIALWETIKQADREHSSLDSEIVASTEVPNDIVGLLHEYPTITHVFFNGGKAESSFRRLVAPQLERNPPEQEIAYTKLPSTSPAHAARSYQQKLQAWSVVGEAAAHT